jgi:hypothetical protein
MITRPSILGNDALLLDVLHHVVGDEARFLGIDQHVRLGHRLIAVSAAREEVVGDEALGLGRIERLIAVRPETYGKRPLSSSGSEKLCSSTASS